MWMRAGPGARILAARKPTKSALPGSMVAASEAMVACWMVRSVAFNQISEAGLGRELSISMAAAKGLLPGTTGRWAAYLIGRMSSGRRSLGASAAKAERENRARARRKASMKSMVARLAARGHGGPRRQTGNRSGRPDRRLAPGGVGQMRGARNRDRKSVA